MIRATLMGLVAIGVPSLVVVADMSVIWIRHRPIVAALGDSVPNLTAYMRRRIKEGRPLKRWRWVPLDSIPEPVACAVLAAENAQFFTMGTVDWTNQRRMIERLLQGDWSHGASGIPQQLARNLFLSPDRTVGRKLREYLLAYQLSHGLSKERLLEMYLNVIEVGDGIWGIAEGSEALFHRPPGELTPTEAVLLANVLPAPLRGLAFPLSKPRRAKLEIVTRVLWRQLVLDDVTWGATTARLRRMGELVDQGLGPTEAAAAVTEEMGAEAALPPFATPRLPLRFRCGPERRGVY